MKRLTLALALLLATSPVMAQHQHQPSADAKPMALISGLGEHHHPVTTRNPEAQRFFDQGLALVYAFNHEGAVRAFKRAAELDPEMAMAHWGVALALGPNINLDIDAEREKLAYEAVQKAAALASKASERERAYIEALKKRYSNLPNPDLKKLAVDYKNAMGELVKSYPDDLDAATLYAESAMNLRPWQLWSADGTPAEGTLEIVAVLESVLKRNPDHIGANHYYIHAVEASPHPEWALPSAQRLKVLTPAAGHLVHMPAHIDMRVGNYEAAARSNAYAAEADELYFKDNGAGGMYPMMYYSHNLHFLAVAHAMQGRFEDAKRAADRLQAHMSTYMKEGPELQAMLPMLDTFIPTPTLVQVRFRRWDDILKLTAPDKRLLATNGLWRFARGMAYAATNQIDKAEAEQSALITGARAMSPDATFGLSKASSVLAIAENILAARIALARNQKAQAVERLRKAVEIEDTLRYNEPADWYIPARESLGGALILSGDYAEAEKVFRADLERNPRSGRSLFGLQESLRLQGKQAAAQFVKREFDAAWKKADGALRVEDL
jgi:tetratricopeptide (TPR) repeat protein